MKTKYKNKSILVTGGTGSFGKHFIKYLLKKKYPFKKIIIFSRDELKQHEMSQSSDFNEKILINSDILLEMLEIKTD